MPGNRNMILLLIACMMLVSITSQEEIRDPQLLDVPRIAQQTIVWCWAASAEMVLTYMGKPIPQCEQADDAFSRTNCCEVPESDDCEKGGWPQFYRYGFTSDSVDAALSWEEIKAQIDNGKPVLFSYFTAPENPFGGGRSGHMMVAMGYAEPHWVYANNPFAGQGESTGTEGDYEIITYDRYVKGKGDFGHWRDYYNIRPRPEPQPETPITEIPESDPEEAQVEVAVDNIPDQPINEDMASQEEFAPLASKPEPIGGYAAIERAIEYPDDIEPSGWTGRVVINARVDENGEVQETSVLQSCGHPEFDRAAITAIRDSKWKPAMEGGNPVEEWVAIRLNFTVR